MMTTAAMAMYVISGVELPGGCTAWVGEAVAVGKAEAEAEGVNVTTGVVGVGCGLAVGTIYAGSELTTK